jgi:sporadic carbohydrate cluster protein (TIGR04323 family)
MAKGHGYRGYNGSRPYVGLDFPQNVQNFLIRNYCQKHNLTFLLSASEYKMTGCYMIFEEVLSGIDALEGIVLFTIFMLPASCERRQTIYKKILDAGCSLHGALEDIAIRSWDDVALVEDILMLNHIALTDDAMSDIQDFLILENVPKNVAA